MSLPEKNQNIDTQNMELLSVTLKKDKADKLEKEKTDQVAVQQKGNLWVQVTNKEIMTQPHIITDI